MDTYLYVLFMSYDSGRNMCERSAVQTFAKLVRILPPIH